MIDAVVVGAGPGGLSAALCLGRSGRQALVLDGGPWRNVPSDAVHNFFTRDGASPGELRATALAQLGRYPSIRVQQLSAEDADGESGNFRVTLNDGRVVEVRRVLLATGVEDVLPEIAGLNERWGQSVVHCPYCHGWERAGQTLGVLAVDALAVHEAIHISRFSDDVTLYTNDDLPMSTEQLGLLESRGVRIHDGRLARVEGPGTSLERIVFSDNSTAACQALFCRSRTRQRSDLAARLGCHLLDDGAVEVNQFGQTTVTGVYAVGDMCREASVPLPAHQVAIAVAQGLRAGVVIDQELLYAV